MRMSDTREIGKIKTYDPIKGFGFIERDKGKNVFVNYAEFEANSDAAALIGALVEFNIVQGMKGPRAIRVKIVG
jgi:CspA family cold shock protein